MKKQDHSRLRISLALTIVVVFLILLTAGLSQKPQLARQSVEAADAGQPTAKAQEEAIEVTEALAASKPSDNLTDTAPYTVNGIEIRFEDAWQEVNKIAVSVCFDLPDDSDWTIWNSTLEIDEKIYRWSEMAPSEIRKPPVDGIQQIWTFKPEGGVDIQSVEADGSEPAYRCETIYFEGIAGSPASTLYTLTIEALEAAPREGEYCSSAYLQKVQDALDAHQTGITIKCIEEEYIDGLEVVTKPETMSMESAKAYISSTDFYLDLNGHRGPWVFTFTLD